MKKTYVKPMVAFESFQMTSNIAGDCEEIIKNQSRDTCGLSIGGNMTAFITKENGCSFETVDGNPDYACYHVPTDDNNLFNS